MSNNIIYSWSFKDKENKSVLWYIIALSIIIGLSIWGFLTKQYALSFVILLISGIYYFIENNSEDNIKVDLTELGIKISNNFYDYGNIFNYSYIYEGENAIYLRLNLNKKSIKYIDLNIDNNIIKDLKDILNNYLEEIPKSELSFGEKIIKLLKL